MEQEQRYNVAMVRDFLDHLKLQLQVSLENLHAGEFDGSETISRNMTLIRKLFDFANKYNCDLLAKTQLIGDGEPEAAVKAARRALDAVTARKREQQIEHLAALEGLFDEALQCAAHPDGRGAVVKKVSVKQLTEERPA